MCYCRFAWHILQRVSARALAFCNGNAVWYPNDSVQRRCKEYKKMMTFFEWCDELERRYDRMPRWYFDLMRRKSEYVEYCDRWREQHGMSIEQTER